MKSDTVFSNPCILLWPTDIIIITCRNPESLKVVIPILQRNLKIDVFEYHVHCGHVLEDTIREMRRLSFDPFKRVKVILLF